MICKEKLHPRAQPYRDAASRNNQAHLKHKSGAGQSLSVALGTSSAAEIDGAGKPGNERNFNFVVQTS
jgi:hypothetical protein